MLHPLFLGFFDESAAKAGKLVVVRPLDLDHANALADRFSASRDGSVLDIQGDRFSFERGYIRCWDIVKSREAAEFVAQLASTTGCAILYPDTVQKSTPDEFMARFEAISRYRERLRQEKANSREPD